jgi:hypothetical protein
VSDEIPLVSSVTPAIVTAFMAEHAGQWLPGGGRGCLPLCQHLWQPAGDDAEGVFDMFVEHHVDCPCHPGTTA